MICKIQFFKVYISKIKHKQNQNTDNNLGKNYWNIYHNQRVDLYKNRVRKSKEEPSSTEEYNNWNLKYTRRNQSEKAMAPHSSTLAWKIPWMEEPGRLQSMGVTKSRTRLSDVTFIFHFHALEKEMAIHSCILAWRIRGMGEPGGLLSMGLHRVGHDWSDLAAVVEGINSRLDDTMEWISKIEERAAEITQHE